MDRGGSLSRAVQYLIILALCGMALLPVYGAGVTSLTRYEHIGSRQIFPTDWAWDNFVKVWHELPLARLLWTTFIYSFGSSIVCVVVGTIAAYGLSRMVFRGRQVFLYFLLVSQVIPLIVLAVPMFRLATSLGLFDTYLGIGIAVTGVHLAFPVMFLKSYLDGIPRDMEEAAQVDGCGQLQALARIVLPVIRPAIFTAGALVFFTSWQVFLIPLVLASSDTKVTVTVGIFRMLSDSYTPWHLMMTASLIACAPPVAIFLWAQKHLVGGLTAGAVK